MIDIHTHILPGVDDGAQTMEEALSLIRQAAEGGTKEIIVTPHCAPAYDFFNFNDDFLEERFERLCWAAERERLPVILHPGMEVLYEDREEFLERREDYATLCGGRYLLMEYYFDVSEDTFLEGIQTARSCGYLPVIAHPERYECIKELGEEPALEGRRLGALLQINKGSLSGTHGELARKRAVRLLDLDAADFVASDAHGGRRRGSGLDRVYRFVESRYGRERARKLFVDNPRRIVGNSRNL